MTLARRRERHDPSSGSTFPGEIRRASYGHY